MLIKLLTGLNTNYNNNFHIVGLLCGVLALNLSLSLTIQFGGLINHLKEKGIISDNYTIPYRYKKLDK